MDAWPPPICSQRERLFPKIYLIENGARYQSNQLYSRYNITKGNSLFVVIAQPPPTDKNKISETLCRQVLQSLNTIISFFRFDRWNPHSLVDFIEEEAFCLNGTYPCGGNSGGCILCPVLLLATWLPTNRSHVFNIFLIFRARVLFYDEFKRKPRYIRVVRNCSHVKDLPGASKSHLAMVSDGTYPVCGVSSA